MRKLYVFGLLLLLLLVVGCAKGTTDGNYEPGTNGKEGSPADDDSSVGAIHYLSAYPIDIMPLFKATKVNANEYWVRDGLNYVIGKDFYSIDFISSASREEISEYYMQILDELDEESSLDKYLFEGYIDERRVAINIPDWQMESEPGNPVHISIGAHREEYASYNKYFENYPDGIIEIYNASTVPHYQYEENYRHNYISYVTSYFTFVQQDEVLDFYRDSHMDSDNFTEDEDEYSFRLSWTEGIYRCSIQYQKSQSYLGSGVRLAVEKDLNL